MQGTGSLTCLLGLALLSGCARLNPTPGKSAFWDHEGEILWWPSDSAGSYRTSGRLSDALGYPALKRIPTFDRNSKGDRLFLQYEEAAGKCKLFMVSAHGIEVEDVPDRSVFDTAGNPVWWYSRDGKFQFANGYTLPGGTHSEDVRNFTDAKYIALRTSDKVWIAPAQTPMNQLIVMPPETRLEVMVCRDDRLHVAYDDVNTLTERYAEYQVINHKATLVRRRAFRWARRIYDFDPESGLILAESAGEIFSHMYLADVNTGARRLLRARWGQALFIKKPVLDRYRDALENATAVK